MLQFFIVARLTNIQKALMIGEIIKSYSSQKLSSSQALLYAQDFLLSFKNDLRIGKEYTEYSGGPNYFSYNTVTALNTYKWKILAFEEINMQIDEFIETQDHEIKKILKKISSLQLVSNSNSIDKKINYIFQRIFSDYSSEINYTSTNQIVFLNNLYGISTYEIEFFPAYLTDGQNTIFSADMYTQMKLIKHGDFRYASEDERQKYLNSLQKKKNIGRKI